MFIKLSVILFGLTIVKSQIENHDWDLAVAIQNRVELLSANGTLIGTAIPRFHSLKALTYDYIRHQFLVSDMHNKKDTIYTFGLNKDSDPIPIVDDLPDDILGLAVDPQKDVLYWTDTYDTKINQISRNHEYKVQRTLFDFEEEKPHDITIDSCKGYIYWSNANNKVATIEKSTLDGKDHKVIINSDLFMPSGIAIDQIRQRIFWANTEVGVTFKIESANLDGTNRTVIYEGSYQNPFGIAVDKKYVYWTDAKNYALYRKDISKNQTAELIKKFTHMPMGLVAKNYEFDGAKDCSALSEAIKAYESEDHTEYFEALTERTEVCQASCLNGGELKGCSCLCPKGFSGEQCEIPICHNYCLNGECSVNKQGDPVCTCNDGFNGVRCESNACKQFCLNNGICNYNDSNPICTCKTGFTGSRCERISPIHDCKQLCLIKSRLPTNDHRLQSCRCDKEYGQESGKMESLMQSNEIDYFHDTPFLITVLIAILLAFVTLALTLMLLRVKHTRPRIKKRIVVSKNVTPLTYRSQPSTEQCEITIENCCNMNVCETPCFEPPKSLGKSKEEKEKLLLNMENGGDDLF